MSDFLLDLGPEFVGSPLEFIEPLARLTRNLRQLLRPKDNQGQEEQEDRLRKTHASSYCRSWKSGNRLRASFGRRRGAGRAWAAALQQRIPRSVGPAKKNADSRDDNAVQGSG